MMRSLSRVFVLGMMVMLISSCAEPERTAAPVAADPILAARSQLIDALDRCGQEHGYDPVATTAIGESALAPNEPAWRQCAYNALRAYQNPDPAVSQQIESLIVEDVAMTAAIQQGKMTRSQRKARNLEKIEAIKALEVAQVKGATAAQAQHDAQLRQMVDGLRGFAR